MVNSSSRSTTVRPCAGEERGADAVGDGAKPQIKAGGLKLIVADRRDRRPGRPWRSGGGGPERAALRCHRAPHGLDTETARAAGWQAGGFSMVGPERFELSTSRPPDGRANQAALRPDTGRYITVFQAGASGKAHRRVSGCCLRRAQPCGREDRPGGARFQRDGSSAGLHGNTAWQAPIRLAKVASSHSVGFRGRGWRGRMPPSRAERAACRTGQFALGDLVATVPRDAVLQVRRSASSASSLAMKPASRSRLRRLGVEVVGKVALRRGHDRSSARRQSSAQARDMPNAVFAQNLLHAADRQAFVMQKPLDPGQKRHVGRDGSSAARRPA